jgi:hypothetical protein
VAEERATRPVTTQEAAPGPSRPDEATLPRQVTTTARDTDSPSAGSVSVPADTRQTETGVPVLVVLVALAVSPPSGLLTGPPPSQVQMPTPGLSPAVPTTGATSTPSISTPTPVSNVTPVSTPTAAGSTRADR